jgi:hypothetical protein
VFELLNPEILDRQIAPCRDGVNETALAARGFGPFEFIPEARTTFCEVASIHILRAGLPAATRSAKKSIEILAAVSTSDARAGFSRATPEHLLLYHWNSIERPTGRQPT